MFTGAHLSAGPRPRLLATLVVLLLTLSACGGDDATTDVRADTPTTEESVAEAATTAPADEPAGTTPSEVATTEPADAATSEPAATDEPTATPAPTAEPAATGPLALGAEITSAAVLTGAPADDPAATLAAIPGWPADLPLPSSGTVETVEVTVASDEDGVRTRVEMDLATAGASAR